MAGLGDAMAEDSKRKAQTEAAAAVQRHQDKLAAASEFDKVDDSWPEAARVAAAEARLQLLSSDKFNPKDADKLWTGVLEASRRPDSEAQGRNSQRTMAQGLQGAADAVRGGGATAEVPGQPNPMDGGQPSSPSTVNLSMLAPGLGEALNTVSTGMMGELGSITPEPTEVTGPFTRSEQGRFALDQLLQQAKIKGMFTPDKFASSPQGIFNTGTGEVTSPAPPKSGTENLSDFEGYFVDKLNVFREVNKREPTAKEKVGLKLEAKNEFHPEFRPQSQSLEDYRSAMLDLARQREGRLETNQPMVQMYNSKTGVKLPVRRDQVQDYIDAGWESPPSSGPATGTINYLRDADTTLEQIDPLAKLAKKTGASGPLMGRWRKFKYETLGGVDMTADERLFFNNLGKLFSSGIFSEGGKTLTASEAEYAGYSLPKPSDTVDTILVKLDALKKYTEQRKANMVKYLPAGQRRQIGVDAIGRPMSPTPPTESAKSPGSRVPSGTGPAIGSTITVQGKQYRVVGYGSNGKPQVAPIP
jgi:hypothetical protein